MLAIDRLTWAFSSQRLWPFSGLKMMTAAARTSGTREPVLSVLNRGVIASCRRRSLDCSRERAAARARASLALRAADEEAEYVGLRAVGRFATGFRTTGFLVAVLVA